MNQGSRAKGRGAPDAPPGPRLRRLLVLIDRSDESAAALAVAARLARALEATLTLLAVAPVAVTPVPRGDAAPIGITALDAEEQAVIDRLAREYLAEVAARLGDIAVETALSWGPGGPAVVAEAAQGEHDLVVLPWHSCGMIGHVLHDHAARHVLDHCAVPVLVVPPAK